MILNHLEILPVHKLKLKWLMHRTGAMDKTDAVFIAEVCERLKAESNYKVAKPAVIRYIDYLYEKYVFHLKRRFNNVD